MLNVGFVKNDYINTRTNERESEIVSCLKMKVACQLFSELPVSIWLLVSRSMTAPVVENVRHSVAKW